MRLVDDVGDRRAEVDLGEQLAAFFDVSAHERVLRLGERRRLGQNRGGHGDIADVVQQRRDAQRMLALAIEARFATERDGQRREATRRAGGVRIVTLAHAHERIDHALQRHVSALQRAERRAHARASCSTRQTPSASAAERSLIFFAVAASRFATPSTATVSSPATIGTAR